MRNTMDQTELVEIRMSVTELQLGMSVTRLDRPWLETSFPVQGFVIRHAADIEALQEQCRYVYVEGQEVVDRRARGLAGVARRKRQVPRLATVDMESELPSAREAYQNTRAMAEEIMQSARMDRAIDVRRATQVVKSCVDSVMRNQDALQILVQMRTKDDYTAQHGMNVCILAAIFGRHLGLLPGEIEKLALSGLVLDVGKMRIPAEILKKSDPLTEDERRVMREHPTHGSRILMSVKGLDPVAVDVAHSHHEHMNGSGYPRGLIAHQIPYFAKIIAILDAYDAITSERSFEQAHSSKEALDIIYQGRGDQFDENLALDFIQCIGVYPAGSLVELNSGEAGIVITTYALNRLRPRVLVVRDPDGEPCRQRVVDLRRRDELASGEPYRISRELPIGAYGIDLGTFLEDGLQLHDEELDPDTSTLINALKDLDEG
ncbi:HD-GYP domain-containing protein (c-di-GMP phosphodiesterase class II) [Halospina denitrificans]|uniref:HD-GYP domain-containing protein (C-di-GMP phosphodiesterase class II) n=2 Tax=Halospina denitrificans TaxID=332522 RepID=A0A4R7K289_9GAMM|nr:HD-GYP domain-containing protein (c-di-GMP phosphodiesterase class II) [Halospina denitrificans]